MSLYEIKVNDLNGKEVSLKEYEGKVLLIVNTATGCGFTPQYNGLQVLYENYKDKGFEILDFPCNQFMNQAPGSDEEIHSFCTRKFSITFKQFAKVDVNGKNASELFKFLKENKKGLFGGKVKWNFTKFLVDCNGNVVGRYAPATKPEDMKADIEKLLQ